jgi:hypothetical protein
LKKAARGEDVADMESVSSEGEVQPEEDREVVEVMNVESLTRTDCVRDAADDEGVATIMVHEESLRLAFPSMDEDAFVEALLEARGREVQCPLASESLVESDEERKRLRALFPELFASPEKATSPKKQRKKKLRIR